MNVVFNPKSDPANLYPRIFTKYLSASGLKIFDLKECLNNINVLRSIDVFHFNWFENINGKTRGKIFIDFCLRVSFILFLRLLGIKIVYTIHNKVPHDENGRYLKAKVIALLVKLSDIIIIHNLASLQVAEQYGLKSLRKVRYLKHPNYVGLYGPVLNPKKKEKKLNLLFIGAVKPYKNLELLIDVVKSFNGEVNLKIAGKPMTKEYGSSLIEASADMPYIKLDLKFIEDPDLPHYIADSDLLVLPYDIKSSLNSGTVILAFSYKRSVICPLIGTMADMHNIENTFHYQYSTKSEHYDQLRRQIRKGIGMYNENPLSILELGENAFQDVLRNNSINIVGAQLAGIYQSLS
jgi:beta-1,4-mannosyltransferase